jgi:hypothetical protein
MQNTWVSRIGIVALFGGLWLVNDGACGSHLPLLPRRLKKIHMQASRRSGIRCCPQLSGSLF